MDLNTERLHIRNLHENDWPDMQCIFIDFNHSKYAAYDKPLPTEETEVKALTKQFAGSGLFYAVYLSYENKMIGYVCFHKERETYDLGYCFHSAFHLHGYAYESTKALIDYLAEVYGVDVFSAGTAIDNIPSCRLLNKLGFVCVSTEKVCFDDDYSFEGGHFILNVK